MKQILTLTDFSQIAENAVEAAFVFASQYGANLTIYHNAEDGDLILFNLNDSAEVEQITLKNPFMTGPIEKWKEMARKYKVNASYLVGSTDLLKKIADIIELLDIDLVIMGSSGAGGKEEFIWGSTTERVVKNIDSPVMVIKSPMKDYRLDNIVFASSFDENEKEILKYALNLLSPPKDAIIHLLSVNTSSFFSQPSVLMKEVMKDFEVMVYPYKVKSHFYADYSVDAGIRHFVETENPDILIMNNKNEKKIKRFLAGSNTIRAINHSTIPVLSIDYKEEE